MKDQCVSVTDLKKNASKYLKEIKKGPKYIFVNNKPVAILVDIDNFDLSIDEPFSFQFNPPLDPNDVLSHFGRG